MSLLAATLFLASCDKGSDQVPNDTPTSDGDGKVEMTFGLRTPDLISASGALPVSKAVPVNEDQLDNLWVLQFDGQTAENTLELCEYYSADKIAGNKVNVALYESKEAVRIYFVANAGPDEFTSLSLGETLGTFEERMLSMANEEAVTGAGYLPMAGVYDGTVTFQEQNVTLTRLVAKIVFTCKVNITAPSESFTINRVQITHVATGTRYKAPTVPSAQTGLFPDATLSDNFTDYALENVDALQESEITRTWYIPENLRGVVEGLTPSTKGGDNVPMHSTCIEVSGDYTKGDAIYDVTYRIYPGQNSSTDFNMIRNNSYTITSTIKGFNEFDLRVVVDRGIPAGSYQDGEWSE